MVSPPAAMPEANPLDEIFATLAELEVHVTVDVQSEVEPSEYVQAAEYCCVKPPVGMVAEAGVIAMAFTFLETA